MVKQNETYKNIWYYVGGAMLIVGAMYYGGKAIAKNVIVNNAKNKEDIKNKIDLLSPSEIVDMYNYYKERIDGNSNDKIDKALMDKINTINGKYQYNFFK